MQQNKENTFDITTRYQRAQQLADGAYKKPKTIAFNTTLRPHWLGDTDTFWYQRDSKTGHSFQIVDAKACTNTLAFDHELLCNALTQISGEVLRSDNLPLTQLDFTTSPEQVFFTAFDKRWLFDIKTTTCELLFPIEDCKVSPDGKQAVFYRDNNLWVRNIASGEERALTQDGEPAYRYATTAAIFGTIFNISGKSAVDALWSPDSKRVLTQVADARKVGVGMPEVVHVPEDGSLRPTIGNLDRRVAMPGDEHILEYRFLSIELETGEIHYADAEGCIVPPLTYLGHFAAVRGWWANDSRYAYFTEDERGTKAVRLRRFDTHTGKTEVIIEDTSDVYVTIVPHSTHLKTLLIPLPNTNELIWFSERSGTGHFYLYDLSTGEMKNPVTQGDWVVRYSLHMDPDRRELTFQSAGREPGANPYYCDICRVNIDTGEFTTVIAGATEYTVLDQRSRISFSNAKDALGVSPSANYIVTTRSRVDEVPVSLLLDRSGKELMVLETADVSGLPEGVTWPEPVMLKAADGVTDIYGVVFRPSNFDPNKSYPIVDCTVNYASPVGSFTNSINSYYLPTWAHAELGCIAVVIFNRGPERLRNRTFNEYQGPLPDAHNSDDSVAGIKQLAERFPYMDINRVGSVEFGHSPRALAGLLLYPDFYKVGVAVNAGSDRRLRPALGLDYRGKDMLQLTDLAESLEGKLLLIAGMLDPFMPVSQTFRMVEALQKARKRFDMLILPNMEHLHTDYTRLRSWDYIVEHLLGIEPPKSLKG
ncbi:S9 family peptidase, partial [Porticoccaceae bacterium]|nr:S9 family peptidase [Porticoccaceae bacterium]